jgi:hypothetical protein
MSSKNVNIYLLKIINKLRIVADPNYENLTPPNLPLTREGQKHPLPNTPPIGEGINEKNIF